MKLLGSASPIAIDVGRRWVHAAQIERTARAERLRAWARIPRAGGDRETWTVDEAREAWGAIRRQGFVGDEVVLAAPAEVATTTLLDMPAKIGASAALEFARGELARMHRLDPGAFQCTTWTLPGVGRSGSVGKLMAVCCPHQRAEALIQPLDAAGAKVMALDLMCLALARAARNAFSPAGLGLIVHLSWECARFVAIGTGRVVYERVLASLGWKACAERLSSATGLEHELFDEILRGLSCQEPRRAGVVAAVTRARPILDEHVRAVIQELRPSLTYLDGRFPELALEGIVVTGEGANLPDWVKGVPAATGVSCGVLGAGEALGGGATLPGDASTALTLAIGLARHQVARVEAAA